jgi:CheY-like chemotaxis protein
MSKATAKVLLIEDSVELAEIIVAVVESMSLQALHEMYGARAIQVIQDEEPDLILLDLGLPDMVGWKIMEALKDGSGPFPIPVVVITAHGDPANRLIGKLQEVSAYLIKPCTPDEVRQVISRVLALDKRAR